MPLLVIMGVMLGVILESYWSHIGSEESLIDSDDFFFVLIQEQHALDMLMYARSRRIEE